MNRRIAAVIFALTVLYVHSLAAAERFRPIHGDDIAYGHYLVTLTADVPGDDVPSLAAELAKTYGGRLEPYAAAGFHGFAIILRPSAARLLSSDPRVTVVEEQATSERVPRQNAPLPPVPARVAPPPATSVSAPAVAAVAPIPFRPASESSAREPWSGLFQYDGAGNIKAIGDNVYRYDGVNRLVRATAITKAQGWTQTYQYDGFGNLLQTTVNDGATPAAVSNVDSSTNRIDSTTPCPAGALCSYGTFDEAGNQTGANDPPTSPTAIVASYTWDTLNMMTDRQEAGRHDIYVYDADDQRIATINYASGGGTQTWHYTLRDPGMNVIREVDATTTGGTATWAWKKDYVHRGGLLLASVTPQARSHFHLDHLGTPRLITNDAGMKLAIHTYWPFGMEAAGSDYDTETRRFTGHERDDFGVNSEETLDYMHARYYMGATGRFLSLDPLQAYDSVPQSWSGYGYVYNSPVMYLDPFGLDCTMWPDGKCHDSIDVPCPKNVECGPFVGFFGDVYDTPPIEKRLQEDLRRARDIICRALPNGRTTGVSGALGAVGSSVVGGELVVNYDTGQVSFFRYAGLQVGWNGVASASIYSGNVSGLKGDNSNYQGGFTGASAAVGKFGGFVESSSGGLAGTMAQMLPDGKVTAAGVSMGVSVAGAVTFGTSATQYSTPTQLGKYWGFGIDPRDWLNFAARQVACK